MLDNKVLCNKIWSLLRNGFRLPGLGQSRKGKLDGGGTCYLKTQKTSYNPRGAWTCIELTNFTKKIQYLRMYSVNEYSFASPRFMDSRGPKVTKNAYFYK